MESSAPTLGQVIRAARKEKGLTLVQVAAATGLSHPFLSQVERNLSQPSMRSLYQIASALGTTQQALLAAAMDATSQTQFVSGMRVLSQPGSHADLTEYTAVPLELTEFFQHEKDEYLYVVAGRIELELASSPKDPEPPAHSTTTELGFREFAYIPGNMLHRYRSIGIEPAVLLGVHTTHES